MESTTTEKNRLKQILCEEQELLLKKAKLRVDEDVASTNKSKLKKSSDEKSTDKKLRKQRRKLKGTIKADVDNEIGSIGKKRSHKRKMTKKKRSRRQSETSSVSSSKSECSRRVGNGSGSEGEWVEKVTSSVTEGPKVKRDMWMTETPMLKTFSRERTTKPHEKPHIEVYDPTKSSRELNPHWKTTGTGLPSTFRRPNDDANLVLCDTPNTAGASRRWRKQAVTERRTNCNHEAGSKVIALEAEASVPENASGTGGDKYLRDEEMNALGAKAIKAELMGDMDLAKDLRRRLDAARMLREHSDEVVESKESVLLLTHTDSRGNSWPLQQARSNPSDLYGGRSVAKNRKRVETHFAGERVRFFADDDKYDIQQMFEREKHSSASESNIQFANIAGKRRTRDDLDDIFVDKIRKNVQSATEQKELARSMQEQQHLYAKLDNCNKCLDSAKMDKRALISMSEKVYLALPTHVGLQKGHCMLIPTHHISCSTQLDEDAWEEVTTFRKALTKLFAAQGKDVIFFEVANKLHRKPHLSIHCVPISDKDAELAPFYFKKAIEESEREWSVNKQLLSLRDKSLRSSIPKGLSYFWVHFGIDSGFAHVIEDQDRFPPNFAEEIIGGLLQLDPQKWRRPMREKDMVAKVRMFRDCWRKYAAMYGIRTIE